jgi:hypothetical protein
MLKTGLSYLNNSATSTLFNTQNNTDLNSNMFFVARVIDISLNSNSEIFALSGGWAGIGSIKFQQLDISVSPINKNKENNNFALPITGQLRNFPLVNELVLIFKGPSKNQTQISGIKNFYYINTVAIWGNQHINAYPDSYFTNMDLSPSMNKSNSEILLGSTQKRTQQVTTIPLNGNSGGQFEEKGNIHPILPFAGDNIFEGRFGNSIRLGSTSKTGGLQNNWSSTGENGSPITILKNGQPLTVSEQGYIPIVENINIDPSSIYLTSTQKIPISVATSKQETGEGATIPFNNLLNKTPISPTSYTTPQIILNSGRLLFNTTTDSIIFSAKKSFVVESREDIGLKSLEGNLNLIADKGIISLGKTNADQSVIRGDDFAIQFDALVGAMKNLCKALSKETQTPIAASASELLIKTLEGIQQQSPNFLSKQVKTN